MDHPHSNNPGQREFEIALVTHFQWLAGEEGKKKNGESHSIYDTIAELLGSKWKVHQTAADLTTCRYTDLYMRFIEYPKLLYNMEEMMRSPPPPPYDYVPPPPPPRPLGAPPYPPPGPRVPPNAHIARPYTRITEQQHPQCSGTPKQDNHHAAAAGGKRAFILPPNTPMPGPPYHQVTPYPQNSPPPPYPTLYHRRNIPPPGPPNRRNNPFPQNTPPPPAAAGPLNNTPKDATSATTTTTVIAGDKRSFVDLTTTADDDDDNCHTTEEPKKKRAKPRTFEERYQELKKFHDEHGHVRIKQKSEENKTGLLDWVRNQKTTFFRDDKNKNKKKGPDFEKRKKLLADLGVEWNPRIDSEELWYGWYEKLKLYKQEHGGEAHVKRRHPQYPKLGSWCYRQRQQKCASTMSYTHERLLNEIGFKWTTDLNNTEKIPFEKRLEQCHEFKAKHGHLRVPIPRGRETHDDDDEEEEAQSSGEEELDDDPAEMERLRFYRWTCTVSREYRRMYVDGKRTSYRATKDGVTEDEINALIKIGFEFRQSQEKQRQAKWEANVQKLKEYHIEHGDFDLPELKGFILNQKHQYSQWKAGKKTRSGPERLEILESMGLFAKSKKGPTLDMDNFHKQLAEVEAFKEEHGHLRFPKTHPLKSWRRRMREVYALWKEGKDSPLTDECREMLDNVGFEWTSNAKTPAEYWDERLLSLRNYYALHGHCNVQSTQDASNAKFLNQQRHFYWDWMQGKKNSLTEERRETLESLGMDWMLQDQFKRGYDALKDFVDANGHCNVSSSEDIRLSGFILRQKHLYWAWKKRGETNSLTAEKREALEKLGIKWRIRNTSAEARARNSQKSKSTNESSIKPSIKKN